MPLTTSQPFKGGGSRDAVGTLNAMLAETKRTAGLPPSPDTYLPEETWLGIIDSTGYATYTDERYFVVKLYCSNDDGDGTTALALTEWTDADPPYRRITATNLKEIDTGTHFLTAGKYVWVHKVWDRSSPEPVERWYFDQAIDVHPAVALGDYTPGAPCAVAVQLCADWAGGGRHGAALVCMLPYTTGNFPNVRSGDVIGVLPYEHGCANAVVAVTGYLDDPIGTIKAWDGDPGDIADGWEITAEGKFIVGYLEYDTYFDPKDNTGGYTYHGQTENNHLDHDDHWHTFACTCAFSCTATTCECTLTVSGYTDPCSIRGSLTLGTCYQTGTIPEHRHLQRSGEGEDYDTSMICVDRNLDENYVSVVCDVTGRAAVFASCPYDVNFDPICLSSCTNIAHSHSYDFSHCHRISIGLGAHSHCVTVGGNVVVSGTTGTELTTDLSNALKHGGALNNDMSCAQCGDTLNLPPFIVKYWIVRVD